MGWADKAIRTLHQGKFVQIRPPGHTQKGSIDPNKLIHLIPSAIRSPQVGDQVLVRVGKQVALHWIHAIDGEQYAICNLIEDMVGSVKRTDIYGIVEQKPRLFTRGDLRHFLPTVRLDALSTVSVQHEHPGIEEESILFSGGKEAFSSALPFWVGCLMYDVGEAGNIQYALAARACLCEPMIASEVLALLKSKTGHLLHAPIREAQIVGAMRMSDEWNYQSCIYQTPDAFGAYLWRTSA
jgi:hypothetical protein